MAKKTENLHLGPRNSVWSRESVKIAMRDMTNLMATTRASEGVVLFGPRLVFATSVCPPYTIWSWARVRVPFRAWSLCMRAAASGAAFLHGSTSASFLLRPSLRHGSISGGGCSSLVVINWCACSEHFSK